MTKGPIEGIVDMLEHCAGKAGVSIRQASLLLDAYNAYYAPLLQEAEVSTTKDKLVDLFFNRKSIN